MPSDQNDDFNTAPIVPSEIMISGRQTVTSYLVGQIDYAIVEYSGRSIIDNYAEFLNSDELKARGYIHKGSFTEFSDALAQTKFRHSIIRTPDGYYDVRVTVRALGSDGRICMTGYGSLNIQEGKGGLTVGEFEPYLSIPQTIIIQGQGMVTAVKWLSPDYLDEDLKYRNSVSNGVVTTSLFIPIRILESGYLAVAILDGGIQVWDLQNKVAVASNEINALLGKIRSTDIISLKKPSTWSIDWSTNGNERVVFSSFNGQVYGRFPVIDFVTPVAVKEVILPRVRVWGTDQMTLPTKITVTTVWSNAPTTVQERELLFSPVAGGWILDLPPGGYHIKVKFEIKDPEQNPDGGKG